MKQNKWLTGKTFCCGCDYNPDQWLETPEIIDQDIVLMQQLGINTVNLGIFSWSRMEPHLGEYDFAWLNDVLDKLDAANINYFMATPGAAFPPYLAHIYPEVLRVDRDRNRLSVVGRNNYCLSSPILRKRLMLLCDQLAREVKNRPGLLGWHLNNELSGECCCNLCLQQWQKFLRDKYRTVEKLNLAWWADFSSNRFADFCEIPIPDNSWKVLPGMHLDYLRFTSHQQLDFLLNEKDAVVYWTPDLPVTHNSWRVFGNFDWKKFAPEIDFASCDVYTHYQLQPGDHFHMAYYTLLYSIYRNMKNSGNFALMETSASSCFVTPTSRSKRPGQLDAAIMEAVANGADLVSFFQWRAGRGGIEQHHGSIITHDNRSDTRVCRDVKALSEKLQSIADVKGARIPAEAALWYDPENNFALESSTLPRRDLALLTEAVSVTDAFIANGVLMDVIADVERIKDYKLVYAPLCYMVSDKLASALEEMVKNGGTLVIGALAGWSDETALSVAGGYPGKLRKLAGLRVEFCDCADDGELGSIAKNMAAFEYPPRKDCKTYFHLNDKDHTRYYSRGLAEFVHLEGAEGLAEWEDGFFDGSPALCCNAFGQGKVYYMAGLPCNGFRRHLVKHLAEEKDLAMAVKNFSPPEGVQFQRRVKADREWLFMINQSGKVQQITLPAEWQNKSVELPAYGALILERRQEEQKNAR